MALFRAHAVIKSCTHKKATRMMMMEIPINQRPRIDIYGPYPEFIENIVQGDEKPLIFVTHCTDKCVGLSEYGPAYQMMCNMAWTTTGEF